jgi:hypothetical protein
MPRIRSLLDMGASVDRVNAFVGPGAQASRRAGAFVRPDASRIDQIAKKSINDRASLDSSSAHCRAQWADLLYA